MLRFQRPVRDLQPVIDAYKVPRPAAYLLIGEPQPVVKPVDPVGFRSKGSIPASVQQRILGLASPVCSRCNNHFTSRTSLSRTRQAEQFVIPHSALFSQSPPESRLLQFHSVESGPHVYEITQVLHWSSISQWLSCSRIPSLRSRGCCRWNYIMNSICLLLIFRF